MGIKKKKKKSREKKKHEKKKSREKNKALDIFTCNNPHCELFNRVKIKKKQQFQKNKANKLKKKQTTAHNLKENKKRKKTFRALESHQLTNGSIFRTTRSKKQGNKTGAS